MDVSSSSGNFTVIGEIDNPQCSGNIMMDPSCFDVVLNLHFKEVVDDQKVKYIAASPPDYRGSFSGSGLPFANEEQAFEGTPNTGVLQLYGNSGQLKLFLPNSYYTDFMGSIMGPSVRVHYLSNGTPRSGLVLLNNAVPYRALTYQQSRRDEGPLFYDGGFELQVRTQAQVLTEAGYPKRNVMHKNFWGTKPPM